MLTLGNGSLDWALAHAILLGDTDVFPRPFEFDAIHHCWKDVRAYLSSQDALTWHVRPHRAVLSAKAQLGFRVITQLDPLDFILFSALIKEICEDVEARRVPIGKHVVHSYRCRPTEDGRLFDPKIGYAQFVDRAKQLIDSRPEITHVALTDIADFYPRIYHHRLENALHAATKKTNHVAAIMGLLKGWNGTETFGIPVGSAPVRVLAEATLMDVDESLLANGVRFVRFNDDYRIFAVSYSEAYRQLAILADVLYRNHGLALQKQKTQVLETKVFENRYLDTPATKEMQSLRDRFDLLVSELGLSNPYEPIVYNELSSDHKRIVDSLNLSQLLQEELQSQEPDFAIVRFVMRRFAQLNDDSLIDGLLASLEQLHPVFPEIINYLLTLRGLPRKSRHGFGGRILDLLKSSIVSELAWHRLWALQLFAQSNSWGQEDQFVTLLADCKDLFVRRKLILALGRASQRHWFHSQWRTLFDESAWPRRALIAAASCMPTDARNHWYRSIEDRLDPLELAVARWAKANPFAP